MHVNEFLRLSGTRQRMNARCYWHRLIKSLNACRCQLDGDNGDQACSEAIVIAHTSACLPQQEANDVESEQREPTAVLEVDDGLRLRLGVDLLVELSVLRLRIAAAFAAKVGIGSHCQLFGD